MLRKPPFWWSREKGEAISAALLPTAFLYDAAVRLRWKLASPHHSKLDVICVGNFTAGGAGKTPTCIFIANLLKKMGQKPAFLSRGFAGRISGPHLVDEKENTARDVGDEPLLLAKHGLTCVSRNRVSGSKLLEESNASMIIMDDGFQNPSLNKDLNIIVVDGQTGIGNGRVIPSGPLRASLNFQRSIADAVIVIGNRKNSEDLSKTIGTQPYTPVFQAHITPTGDIGWLKKKSVIAYSGIGRPEKFYETLRLAGAKIVKEMSYPDHHNFSIDEASDLLFLQDELDADLVTTEKDYVRLSAKSDVLANLKKRSRTLPVELKFSDDDLQKFKEWIADRLKLDKL